MFIQVLGMIEEAAGTRMFEVKKEASLRTIEKKERKLEEIRQILDQEITPKLEKLRQQKSQYVEWSTANSDVERLERFVIAFAYTEAEVLCILRLCGIA